MIALIQRVKKAQVDVDGQTIGQINQGILALVGVEKSDNQQQADDLLRKIIHYRIFSDDNGKMNLSLNDTGGELLLVSQFTLVANTQKGLRPSFSSGASPAEGERLFNYLCQQARKTDLTIATGEFAADMQVSLVNDGPVTFWLQS
ncbi:MAG: D-aminoacyl-tRNA deacylase [Proteobacteria bacterium]|nr:D-aminoacyl-tRNA deacylase [Pseudomonadota bacterium]